MDASETGLYHITHGGNLASIIEDGALSCYNELDVSEVESVAYEGIQDRRANWTVPCGPGGVLHDYVPFYFAPRSPMLYAIHTQQIEGTGDQRAILHLVTTIGEIRKSECEFVFTDGHAIIALSEYYDSTDELRDRIDWNVMEATYWNDTDDDPDRKRRRQAEFLVQSVVPWTCITEIGVSDEQIAARVRDILETAEHKPTVCVRKNWYY